MLSLWPAGIARAFSTVNFFGQVPQSSWGVEMYLTWGQTPNFLEWISGPMAITDDNFWGAATLYFHEVGPEGDRRPQSFDPNMHPYQAWQDGADSTYHLRINSSIVLAAGPYQYKISRLGYKWFRAYFCSGVPLTCQQIGDDVFSGTHDSYTHTAVGYESPTGTPLTQPLTYVNANYRWPTNGVWYPFCPQGYPPFATGAAYAIILACSPGAGSTANFIISPANVVFSPFVKS
jgi:hypothetical protein